MNPKTIVEPTEEPITLEEARLQCRVEAYGTPASHPEDPLLELYIAAAREWAENYTGLALCPQTLEQALDEFPDDEIEILRGPVRSITSVKYVDEDEAVQTMSTSAYTLDDYSDRIWLLPAAGTEWPTPGEFTAAVKIRYEAGYSIPGSSPQDKPLPKRVRAALLLIIAHLYRNREETVERALSHMPLGVKSFLDGIRVRQGMA